MTDHETMTFSANATGAEDTALDYQMPDGRRLVRISREGRSGNPDGLDGGQGSGLSTTGP